MSGYRPCAACQQPLPPAPHDGPGPDRARGPLPGSLPLTRTTEYHVNPNGLPLTLHRDCHRRVHDVADALAASHLTLRELRALESQATRTVILGIECHRQKTPRTACEASET